MSTCRPRHKIARFCAARLFETDERTSSAGMMSQPAAGNLLPQARLVAERRWRLGAASREHPSAIMSRLMRFMASNHIAWKKGGSYNLRCRRVLTPQGGALPHPSRPHAETRLRGICGGRKDLCETPSGPPQAAALTATEGARRSHSGVLLMMRMGRASERVMAHRKSIHPKP